MALPPEVVDQQALERVSKLRLVARTVVESFVSGQHRSVYKGFSVEFAQHREYSRGDEIRHIDWKVFGKSDRLFVKQYEEETNLRAHICFDASGSMRYAGSGGSKFDYARKCAAALAYLMIGQSDGVGLVTFDDRIRTHIPARSTSGHLNTVFKHLADTKADRETNLAPILHDLAGRIRRRGLVVVLSDFFAPTEDLVQALAHLHHRRHEAILMQVLDPREIEFPFDEMYEFRCLERPGVRLRLDAPRVAKLYRERFAAFQDRLREACHRCRFDYVVLPTDRPCDAALAQYLTYRQGR